VILHNKHLSLSSPKIAIPLKFRYNFIWKYKAEIGQSFSNANESKIIVIRRVAPGFRQIRQHSLMVKNDIIALSGWPLRKLRNFLCVLVFEIDYTFGR